MPPKPKRPDLKGLGLRLVANARAEKPDHPVRHIVADEGLLYIPTEFLRPNPNQPRQHFDEGSLRDLTASVKEKGILQPIIARKDPDSEGYIIIAGERRWRAATAAGLATMPALVRGVEDALEVAIIENLQRENLSALDEAEALLNLKHARGFTDDQLAKVVGKSRSSVTEALSLNKLPEAIRAECRALDIGTKIQLLAVLRAGDEGKMRDAWEAFKTGKATTTRQLKAHKQDSKSKPKQFRFQHKPAGGSFQVIVTFSKRKANSAEIKEALRDAMQHLPES
jgi:ParB family chromosome partitioning protein